MKSLAFEVNFGCSQRPLNDGFKGVLGVSSVVNAVTSRLAICAVVIPVALSLTGCGKSWDGRYEAVGYRSGEVVLEVKGSTAVRSRFQYGSLSFASAFSVEQKSDKVIFSLKGGDNATYVYAQAADDRGLKCISDSCNSMFSPLSKEWVRMDKK